MTATKNEHTAALVVRFVGPDVSPEKIPLGYVGRALSAVQDLASGRDRLRTKHVPVDKGLGLVEVRPGSAIYVCVPRAPDDAYLHLNRLADLLNPSLGVPDEQGDSLVAALDPIRDLSNIARLANCQVEVSLQNGRKTPLVVIEKDAYERLSDRMFLTGETSVIGTIKRVGGETSNRCLMKLPGRKRLLYCDVDSKKLSQRLGQNLYEQVAATGQATWLHRSWYMVRFKIQDFTKPKITSVDDMVRRLRTAGMSGWDDVADPDAAIREMR